MCDKFCQKVFSILQKKCIYKKKKKIIIIIICSQLFMKMKYMLLKCIFSNISRNLPLTTNEKLFRKREENH